MHDTFKIIGICIEKDCSSRQIFMQLSLKRVIAQLVRIATRLRAVRVRNHGWIPDRSNRFISTPKCPDRLWGTSSLLQHKYWCVCGVKWQACESDPSPPPSRLAKGKFYCYTALEFVREVCFVHLCRVCCTQT